MSAMYHIEAVWDDEASVWVATSEDVPGLVAEDTSLAGLKTMVAQLIPVLLEANAIATEPPLRFSITARAEVTGLAAA